MIGHLRILALMVLCVCGLCRCTSETVVLVSVEGLSADVSLLQVTGVYGNKK